MKQINKNAHAAIFLANIIFGLNTVVSKTLMPFYLSSTSLTFIRMMGAFLTFFIASWFIKKEKIDKKDYIALALAAIFGVFINQYSYIQGLSKTSPIDAVLVITILPILTMLLSAAYLKEPITKLKTLGVLTGALGAIIIIFQTNTYSSGESSFTGNFLCFISSLSYAIYIVLFKQLMNKYHPITIMKWMFLYATIICLPFSYSEVSNINFATWDIDVLLKITFVVLGATFFSYLFIPYAVSKLRPTTVSMYNYVQPLVASLVAIIIGLDSFNFIKLLAAIFIFIGVFLVTQSKSRIEEEIAE